MNTSSQERRQALPASEGLPAHTGKVVSVRGSVVDLSFDEQLPPIYSMLRAGPDKQIVIEVQGAEDRKSSTEIARLALAAFQPKPKDKADAQGGPEPEAPAQLTPEAEQAAQPQAEAKPEGGSKPDALTDAQPKIKPGNEPKTKVEAPQKP